MELTRGLVVRSAAGHDKGGFFVILEAGVSVAVICDGKRRSLEHPKKKNSRHLYTTNTRLSETLMQTNRAIRRALAEFQSGGRFPQEEASVCRNRT